MNPCGRTKMADIGRDSIHASRNVKVFISFSNTIIASCFGFVLFCLLAALVFFPAFPLDVNVVDRSGLTEFCEKPPLLAVKTLF